MRAGDGVVFLLLCSELFYFIPVVYVLLLTMCDITVFTFVPFYLYILFTFMMVT